MATTFIDYTGDGNATKSFSFPSIQESDVKVEVDEVVKTSGVHYNITSYTTTGGGNVVFTSGNIPSSPSAIRIFRDTDVDNAKATYTAGSSVKAADLNANHEQLLFAAQEEQNQTVITSHIKDGAVTSAKIKAGTIVNADINASAAIEGSKIQASSGSVAGTMSSANFTKLSGIETGATADQTNAEIRAAVEAASDSNVFTDADHSKLNGIEAGATADQTASEIKTLIASSPLDASHLAANSVDNSELVDGSVTSAKIANGTIQAVDLATNAVATDRIADGAVTSLKIADSNVSTIKLADAELRTLAGMQSGTASILASGTALTATTAELNQLDGITLETSVTTNSDTRIPTSKAVNDLVLSVTNALGGFVAIANETSFPTSNPDPSNNAGTVVSISQLASGLAVNGSGVATITNGAGTGNTVTITGFPSSLVSQTLPASSGLQVQTTSTLHTYTFHKQLASAADIQAISATVNSFSNRYRVSASAPTSSLDGGDLWYDTTNSKLMVYSSQNSAWEESSAIGNFFICTVSSSSNSGGGASSPNGTATRFTISNAPTTAAALIVSVDGVVQKPNAGSSPPSEGFVLVGNDIIFGAAPANGASLFVTAIGSTVGIGTPSDNTVTSAILQNGSVVTDKIADQAVTLAKLPHGTSSNNGKFLRANNGADPSFETVSAATGNANAIQTTDGSGNFTASNTFTINGDTFTGHDILLAQDSGNTDPVIAPAAQANITLRTSSTQSGTFGSILDNSGLQLGRNSQYVKLVAPADQSGQTSYTLTFPTTAGSNGQALTTNGSGTTSWTTINSDLVDDTSPQLGGNLDVNSKLIDFHDSSTTNDDRLRLGAAHDLQLYHDSTDNTSKISNITANPLKIFNVGSNGATVHIQARADEEGVKLLNNSGESKVELYYNNSKKLETVTAGTQVNGVFGVGLEPSNAHNSTYVVQGKASSQCLLIAFRTEDGTNTGSNGMLMGLDGNYHYVLGRENRPLQFGAGGSSTLQLETTGHLRPVSNNSYDLGTSSYRWRNIYTGDLNLSNKGSSNDVDGSWGDWTIQEGESDLFLKNNRSGKKYKFNLTEVS